MSDSKDSLWERWYYRTAVVAAVLASLTYLFGLPRTVRETLFGIKPAGTVANGSEQPGGKGSAVLGGNATPPSTPPPARNPSERYVNTAISRREDMRSVAILIMLENGESLPDAETTTATLLTKRHIQPVRSFFTPAFIQDGKAKLLYSGDWTISRALDLGTRVDYVLIGLGKVSYSPNEELGGVLTANLDLPLSCMNVVSQSICGHKSLITQGAGYTEAAALQSATDHLQHELASFVGEAF